MVLVVMQLVSFGPPPMRLCLGVVDCLLRLIGNGLPVLRRLPVLFGRCSCGIALVFDPLDALGEVLSLGVGLRQLASEPVGSPLLLRQCIS